MAELNLYIYDTSFKLQAIVEQYESLIWTDRYDECGDFELMVPFEDKWTSILQKDFYCHIDYSDRWCVIEKIEQSKEEDGPPRMIVSGRSLESIIERRIVPGKVEFGTDTTSGYNVNVQSSIQSLINSHVINPSDTNRKINNFIFSSNSDSNVTSKTFHESYNGNSILDIVEGVCKDKHLGFKIILNDSNQFVFSLYCGVDRTMAQNANSYVIFSTYFDNLKSSSYFCSKEEYRNFAYVSKDENQFINTYNTSSVPSGLERREVQFDASELNDNKKDTMTNTQIQEKAKKKLNDEFKIKTGIEGEIVSEKMYKYREHYNVGDRVQFKDMYGNSEAVYISEVVISYDENGLTILPTFQEIDWT